MCQSLAFLHVFSAWGNFSPCKNSRERASQSAVNPRLIVEKKCCQVFVNNISSSDDDDDDNEVSKENSVFVDAAAGDAGGGGDISPSSFYRRFSRSTQFCRSWREKKEKRKLHAAVPKILSPLSSGFSGSGALFYTSAPDTMIYFRIKLVFELERERAAAHVPAARSPDDGVDDDNIN